MKYFARVLAVTALAAVSATQIAAQPAANPRFVCDIGYSLAQCHEQVEVLRSVLNKYPIQQLGQWTWVLVRSQNWKPILLERSLDSDTPAFSYLEKRETFIEEALLTEIARRRAELLKRWRMSSDKLLELAVTHELGHALCNERNEAKADHYGEELRDGKSPVCEKLQIIK